MSEKENDKLGFWSIVLLAINAIIGSGIFLTPASVVQQAGSRALLVYFIAAIFAAVLAISFLRQLLNMLPNLVRLMLMPRLLLVIRLAFIWELCVTFQQVLPGE